MSEEKDIEEITNNTKLLNINGTLSTRLKNIIKKNTYISNNVPKKPKNINSLSYLINTKLTQSQCIRLGCAVEKVLCDIILNYTNLINIRKPNVKGSKEKDHLFMDEHNKIVYYAELKSNIQLDTEKRKATYQKCIENKLQLRNEYKDYSVKMFLVSCRHYTTSVIPSDLTCKYSKIKKSLVGINDYFSYLGADIHFDSENHYKKFLNYIVKKMLKL